MFKATNTLLFTVLLIIRSWDPLDIFIFVFKHKEESLLKGFLRLY